MDIDLDLETLDLKTIDLNNNNNSSSISTDNNAGLDGLNVSVSKPDLTISTSNNDL